MGFLINCTNKGCGKLMEPVLEVKTNIVFCTDCGKEMPHVTDFTKNQMKSLGQTKKTKSGQSFAVKCTTCGKEGTPTLSKDKFFCFDCKNEISNISAPFAVLLKQKLKKS